MWMTGELQWTFESLLLVPSNRKVEETSSLPLLLRNELGQYVELVQLIREGKHAEAYNHPWIEKLTNSFLYGVTDTDDIDARAEAIRGSCQNFVQSDDIAEYSEDVKIIRQMGILAFAVLHLEIYLQVNWTGPSHKDATDSTNDAINHAPSAASTNDMAGNGSAKIKLRELCIFGNPNTPAIADDTSQGKQILASMAIDGEVLYHLVHGLGYLWGAIRLISFLIDDTKSEASLLSLFIWYPRVTYVWQRSLLKANTNTSPTLLRSSLSEYVYYLKQLKLLPEGFSIQKRIYDTNEMEGFVSFNIDDILPKKYIIDIFDEMEIQRHYCLPEKHYLGTALQSAILLELSLRLASFGYIDSFDIASGLACDLVGLSFELTGRYGIRRKHQKEAIAQLVVKVDKRNETNEETGVMINEGESNKAHTSGSVSTHHKKWSLLDADPGTDLLETPQFSKGSGEVDAADAPLTAYEQCLILARGTYLVSSHPSSSETTLEELNALVQRCLVLPAEADSSDTCDTTKTMRSANWLVFSAGLWLRCKAEHHRWKTAERACLQLQALLDQYDDVYPSASHRLEYIYCLDYPSRWEAQRELGMRMLNIGSFVSAFNMFKDLAMWEEAVECLIASGRRAEAAELLNERLAIFETPSLWCSKGDLEHEMSCYENAWNISGKRYARAQRAIGNLALKKEDIPRAIEAFEKALSINPLHGNSWFSIGYCFMRTTQWDKALEAFGRVVGIDSNVGEAWANMAGIHSQKEGWKEARICIEQAVKLSRENWKTWDSFVKICVRVRDIRGVIRGVLMIVETLQQKNQLAIWVFEFLVDVVTKDSVTADDARTGQYYQKSVAEMFSRVSNAFVASPKFWELYSILLLHDKQYSEAWELQLRQLRALQARLFVDNLEEGQSVLLMEMLDKLVERFSLILKEEKANSSVDNISRKREGELRIAIMALRRRILHTFEDKFCNVCNALQEFANST